MALTEADTRAKLLDPALYQRGWTEDLIRREETAGAIEVVDGQPRRRSRGRVDYVLRIKVNPDTQPVAAALIEAKAEHLPPDHGLEQAKAYAASKRLNVKFVFASNGRLFVAYDRDTGLIGEPRPLSAFPTPAELRARYEERAGFNLADAAAAPLLVRYHGGEGARRYYQDAAIRAVLEQLARCERTGAPKRALLSLATGAGKTFIAVNLLRRIADAGQLRRALFLCDRDELRNQASAALQNAFGANAARVEGHDPAKNARVLVATYQTLGVDREDADATFLTEHYPPDYFSHLIIDECHRSAWGKWSLVLTRNPNAVQIGLTATPRQLEADQQTREAAADRQISADNVAYFGEPVYEYDMAQGIEDGYLAACEVVARNISVDATGVGIEEIMAHGPTDALTGAALQREDLRTYYAHGDFEDRLLLPDRVEAMCTDLFACLLATGGPTQKTIIFGVRDQHADAVTAALNNRYAAWCARTGAERADPYAFKCTAAGFGNEHLADLRGSSGHHFVATTVDLLTTGVDVPAVRNVVFFRYVRSPIAFYQMVGRGTRLDPASGKLMFRVYDYTNATRLFGAAFLARFQAPPRLDGGEPESSPRPAEPVARVEGIDVFVNGAGKFVVTMVDGKALPVTVEDYKARLAERLLAEAPTLADFRRRWVAPADRQALLGCLPDGGRAAEVVRALEERQDCDLFDVLAEVGYGQAPHTRMERAVAFGYKHRAWLEGLPEPARAVLAGLAAQFALTGTEGLENPNVFATPEVARAGGVAALRLLGRPADVLREAKERIFAA